MGYSAGGHLVALLGTTGTVEGEGEHKHDTRLQAVVAGGRPPAIFAKFLLPAPVSWLCGWGGSRQDFPQNYEQASPLAFVTSKSPPMFFFNSTTDELVKPTEQRQWSPPYKRRTSRADVYIADKGNNHVKNAADPDALQKSWGFLREATEPEIIPNERAKCRRKVISFLRAEKVGFEPTSMLFC